jgi:hypothetical protein
VRTGPVEPQRGRLGLLAAASHDSHSSPGPHRHPTGVGNIPTSNFVATGCLEAGSSRVGSVPDLRWRTPSGVVLPAGSWKPGKDVVLGSDDFAEPPGHFTIYRRPGLVQRRFRERRGLPAMIEFDRLKAGNDHDTGGSARSEPWRLPTPPGLRIRWRALFEDDQLNRSPILNISRLGTMSPNIGVGAPIPQVPGVEATFGISVEITASVDPVVEFSVLTPWGVGDGSLDDFLRELVQDSAGDGEDPEAGPDEFVSYLAPLLPSVAPAGWEFGLSEAEREIPEGERVEVVVELRAPTRASSAFAIQMRTVDQPETLLSATDLLVVEVPEDGADARLLVGGDPGAGGISISAGFEPGRIPESELKIWSG